MNSSTANSKFAAALFAAGLSFGLPAASFANVDNLPGCGENNSACSWRIDVDGQEVGSGTYSVGESGNISFEGQSIDLGGGASVSLDRLSGNVDPVLGFNASGATGATGKTFAFSVSLPIALSGPINANSSVSYSLTSTTGAGAQIAPLVAGHVVVAQEVDTSVGGVDPLNKGVDVGDKFFFVGGPLVQNSPVYTASNSFAGNLAYDLMAVTISFSLSANSNVGLSGFVQQVPVPEPSTYGMLAAGLLLLGFAARRRLS